MQLAGRVAQQRETGADDPPVVFGVAGWRQCSDGGQRGFKAGNGVERCDQFENAAFFPLEVSRKAQALINLFAESPAARE